MKQLSGIVMTYNEEANLDRCLRSLAEVTDEIVVIDSHSTDRTVDIARGHGARILLRPFQGFREQRTFAINAATFDRVLILDADEELSEELRESIRRVKGQWDKDCYWCNRLNRIGDKWLRHGKNYPDRKMRLFDRRKYISAGINPHDQLLPAPGATAGRLSGDILHHSFRDMSERAHKINGLSSHAAQALFDLGKRGSWIRLLVKPPSRFFIDYFLYGGFRDGFYGYAMARTQATYVFYREIKLMELRRKARRSDQASKKLPTP